MAPKQPGTAYAFFKCSAPASRIRAETPKIRKLSRIPPLVSLSLSSPKAMKGDDEIIAISKQAVNAGINYSLKASYRGKGNEETAVELKAFLNQAYNSPLYQDGETFRGAIVYERSGRYVDFNSGTLFFLDIMQYDGERDLQKASELNKSSVLSSQIDSTWNDAWNISMSHIKPAYIDNRGDFLVLYSRNNLVAMGGVQKVDGKTAVIKKIRVHPDYRRQGLAELLMTRLEERARELGYKTLITNVQTGNSAMQSLCLKLGFKAAGDVQEGGLQFVMFAKTL